MDIRDQFCFLDNVRAFTTVTHVEKEKKTDDGFEAERKSPLRKIEAVEAASEVIEGRKTTTPREDDLSWEIIDDLPRSEDLCSIKSSPREQPKPDEEEDVLDDEKENEVEIPPLEIGESPDQNEAKEDEVIEEIDRSKDNDNNLEPTVKRFMEWEEKMLKEMWEERGWTPSPRRSKTATPNPRFTDVTDETIEDDTESKGKDKDEVVVHKKSGLLELGSSSGDNKMVKEMLDDGDDVPSFERAEQISIEASVKKLKSDLISSGDHDQQTETEAAPTKKYCSSGTNTADLSTFTEKIIIPTKSKCQGTSTTADNVPKKTQLERVSSKTGLQLLMEQVDKNIAEQKADMGSPVKMASKDREALPWESGMVSMIKGLRGSLDKDSDNYKNLKDDLMTRHREYVCHRKQRMLDSSSSSSSSESEDSEAAEAENPSGNLDDLGEEIDSAEKLKMWFEGHQAKKRVDGCGQLKETHKSFMKCIFDPGAGKTEEEVEDELHKRDAEQMLKNSQSFYERFLKLDDLVAEAEKRGQLEAEDEEVSDSDEIIIREAKENEAIAEEKRLDEEMNKTTEMFQTYLRSCSDSTDALAEIERALG